METLERLTAARQILVQAEAAVGLNRPYPLTHGAHALSMAQAGAHGAISSEGAGRQAEESEHVGAPGIGQGGGLEAAVGSGDAWSTGSGDAWSTQLGWPVPSLLAAVLPHGLMRGMTLGVHGSRLASLLVAGLASSQGAWVACIGIPDMSWGMALLLGMNFERVVLVPEHTSRVLPQAISTAIDGFDVVLVGQRVFLDPREKRLLTRRALSRKILLIGEGWESREQVRGRLVGVDGLHDGSGHITSLNMDMVRPGGKPCRIAITQQGWGAGEAIRAVPHPCEGAVEREKRTEGAEGAQQGKGARGTENTQGAESAQRGKDAQQAALMRPVLKAVPS